MLICVVVWVSIVYEMRDSSSFISWLVYIIIINTIKNKEKKREISVMRMEMKGGTTTTTQAVVNSNGNFVEEEEEEAVSSFKFSYLLASKDRDFLLSSTGTQVLYLSIPLTTSVFWIFIHGLVYSTVCHYTVFIILFFFFF